MELGTYLRRLIQVAGSPLGSSPPPVLKLDSWGAVGQELAGLLREVNGFYAFESALLVRPMMSASGVLGLFEWNQEDRWKAAYEGLADGTLCFAEDLFGGQFCLSEEAVVMFDPETGEQEHLAASLDGWAQELLEDYETLTAQPLAHAWQASHGLLEAEQRLVPKLPFVLGGAFDVTNLRVGNSTTEMLARASLAMQIRNLPDGASIRLAVVD